MWIKKTLYAGNGNVKHMILKNHIDKLCLIVHNIINKVYNIYIIGNNSSFSNFAYIAISLPYYFQSEALLIAGMQLEGFILYNEFAAEILWYIKLIVTS